MSPTHSLAARLFLRLAPPLNKALPIGSGEREGGLCGSGCGWIWHRLPGRQEQAANCPIGIGNYVIAAEDRSRKSFLAG